MKVHPAICMKTKDREKYACRGSGKAAGGRARKPAECRRGHDSNFWLLTHGSCSQNEGASGDMYENKRSGKVRLQGIRKSGRRSRSEAFRVQEGHDSNFWLLTPG